VKSNYGMDGKPVSRDFGNITYTASITMDYNTQQILRSTYGSLMDIGEFDMIISFTNPMAQRRLGDDHCTPQKLHLHGRCIGDLPRRHEYYP
jgi:hypothetical protein